LAATLPEAETMNLAPGGIRLPKFGMIDLPYNKEGFRDEALEARRALLTTRERHELGIYTEEELDAPREYPSAQALRERGVDLAVGFELVELSTLDYFIRKLPDGRLDFRETYAFEKWIDPNGLLPEILCGYPPPSSLLAPLRVSTAVELEHQISDFFLLLPPEMTPHR
jgi:hypothetical protein